MWTIYFENILRSGLSTTQTNARARACVCETIANVVVLKTMIHPPFTLIVCDLGHVNLCRFTCETQRNLYFINEYAVCSGRRSVSKYCHSGLICSVSLPLCDIVISGIRYCTYTC